MASFNRAKRYPKKNKNKKPKKKRRPVIGSGSYGYVFKPPLSGSNRHDDTFHNDYCCKLMISEDADEEYRKILLIIDTMKFDNHFFKHALDDIIIYKPTHISFSDIPDHDKCKKAIQKLPHTTALAMPFKGPSIANYIGNDCFSCSQDLTFFLNQMISLLFNTIVPMNKKGIYHQDVKDENIIIDNYGNLTLIDWGLTLVHPSGPVINANSRFTSIGWGSSDNNTPMRALIQYNTPLSASFLFKTAENGVRDLQSDGTYKIENYPGKTGLFNKHINSFLSPNEECCYNNIIDIIEDHILRTRRNSHFTLFWAKILKPSICILHSDTNPVFDGSSKKALIHYFKTIFNSYFSINTFAANQFYSDWYNNTDIWGWVTCLFQILWIPLLAVEKEYAKTVRQSIAKCVIYMLTDGIKRIDPHELYNILKPALYPQL